MLYPNRKNGNLQDKKETTTKIINFPTERLTISKANEETAKHENIKNTLVYIPPPEKELNQLFYNPSGVALPDNDADDSNDILYAKDNKKNNIIDFKNKYEKEPKRKLKFKKIKFHKKTFIVVALIILISIAVFLLTHKNAQQVFLGDRLIGIIKDKDLTAEELTNTALAKLKEELGTDVLVNEEITLRPIHASKDEIVSTEYALSQIAKLYTFKVSAATIVVDGVEIATVQSEDVAKELLATISSQYVSDDANLTEEPSFVQDVEIVPSYVVEADISSSETALSLLTVNSEQGQTYEIKAGDTLYQIAIDNDMTMSELLEINPDLTETTVLKIGQEINLIVPVPLLSVVTKEQTTYTETIQKSTEYVNNDEEYKTYRSVISAGSDGSKEVTATITKVNGVEQEREIISETVITEPVAEVVEVGTLETPPKKAIGSFIYPVSGAQLTSTFSYRWGTMHYGIDLACASGTPIKASDGGTVTFSGWSSSGYGYMVTIDHGNGFVTNYAHNSSNVVTVGQKVAQGEIIAYVGSTGDSTGNHVHFEIVKDGVKQNPLNYLK